MRTIDIHTKGIFDPRSGAAGYCFAANFHDGNEPRVWSAAIEGSVYGSTAAEIWALGRALDGCVTMNLIGQDDQVRLITDCREALAIVAATCNVSREDSCPEPARRIVPVLRDSLGLARVKRMVPYFHNVWLVWNPSNPVVVAGARRQMAEDRERKAS